jgi:hypothetical protein
MRRLIMATAGIFDSHKVKVADFSYAPNDALAQMIVDAWVNERFKELLLQRENAKALFADRGFYWNGTAKNPVVISEGDYNKGHTKEFDDDIVFVLPDHDGTCPPGQNLLDTARLLMGATPNGI